MSHDDDITKMLGEDPAAFFAGLQFDPDAAVADSELPPTSEQIEQNMITTSLKLPVEMRDRLREVAGRHAITPSMLIRQFIELGLAAEQPGRMIPLSDAIRVLASLRSAA